MTESLVNSELEGIFKEENVDQFKANTWMERERQRKLVKTASLGVNLVARSSGIWSKSATDSTAPLVRAFHGQTVIRIRMEKKDERVQGKDKGNFGVSLQLR